MRIVLQDSNSEYKDSGIEGPEVEAELDSLPSSGVKIFPPTKIVFTNHQHFFVT